MRIARFSLGDRPSFGQITGQPGDEIVTALPGDVLRGDRRSSAGDHYNLRDVTLLAPVEPTKVIAVGRNYHDHASEMNLDLPRNPRIFLKPPSSIIPHGSAIEYPEQSHEVHYEAELAVVIGRTCRNVSPTEAAEVILGYTCANDVTARDIQRQDGMPVYAKAFDTFCPLGPWIETDFDGKEDRITCTVNGEIRQDGKIQDMIWSVSDLIAFVTAAMTLNPGDVLLTGTPSGVGPILPGDEVTVAIERIGALSNAVKQSSR